MEFTPTPLEGTYLIDLEKRGDARGFFARLFCEEEFAAHHLESQFLQANNSLSQEKGTLRGMHYQLPPHGEAKLVRCIQGALYDVVLDLRPDSPSYLKWFGHTLTQENRTMMYVPPGCAHGFLTLKPDTEALYWVSARYAPQSERGVRWNDPTFAITWPESPQVISEKDRSHPDFQSQLEGSQSERIVR